MSGKERLETTASQSSVGGESDRPNVPGARRPCGLHGTAYTVGCLGCERMLEYEEDWDPRMIDTVRSRLRWWRLTNLCTRFVGHWLKNVEEGVARCRICGCLIFCSHASDEAFFRVLGGHLSTCAHWVTEGARCDCGMQK